LLHRLEKRISVLLPCVKIFKHNFRVLPLGLVLSEIEKEFIHNKPENFLVGDHFCHSHRAMVHVFVTIRPFIAGVWGAAFDVFPHHSRTLLMEAKASSGDWSTEMVAVKFGSGLFMAGPPMRTRLAEFDP
jgi:hypothetical protein